MRLPADYNSLSPAARRAAREQYAEQQGGKCMWCGAPLGGRPAESRPVNRRLFPAGFFAHSIHLQHNHRSGKTEGAVHAHCNAVMWQYHGR